MNCPQCHTEIPEDSVFCPRCGASTRPLAFSYLPGGAPNWPVNGTERPPFAAPTDTMAAPPPTAYSSEKVTPQRTRSAGAILSIVAAIVLIPLLGAGLTFGILWANGSLAAKAPQAAARVTFSTPNPANTATPATGSTPSTQTSQLPNPTSFTSISSASSRALGIQLKIPMGWAENPPSAPASDGLIQADFHPQQQLGIDITISRVPVQSFGSSSTTADVNQAYMQGFSTLQGVSNFTPVTPSTPQQTLGGSQWDEQDATFSNSNNTGFHITVITVKHKTWYYSFIYYAPQQVYAEAQTKYITPIFGSFQFMA